MQKRKEVINYLESEINETIENIEVLRNKIKVSRNKIKVLEDEIEMEENLQYALESALEVIKAFDDNQE